MKITKEVEVAISARAEYRDGSLAVVVGLSVPYGTEGKRRNSYHAEAIADAPEMETIRKAMESLVAREGARLFPKAEQMASQAMAAACARKEM